MHDAYLIGIPTLVIILGILLNRSDVRELRTEMRAEIRGLRGEMTSEISGLRSEIANLRSEFHHEFREFYRTLGQHDVRIENLEKRDLS
jgi:hypothetical protein